MAQSMPAPIPDLSSAMCPKPSWTEASTRVAVASKGAQAGLTDSISRMGHAWILGESSPSMMRPESFQCSISLIPGSCGCRLVMFCAVLASQMLTMCLSALITFRLDPPAQYLCLVQDHRRWSYFADTGYGTGAGHAAARPKRCTV